MKRVIVFLLSVMLLNGTACKKTVDNTDEENVIKSFEWIGDRISYPDAQTEQEKKEIGPDPEKGFLNSIAKRGDTFPMTWADDGEIYTSAGDPHWGIKGHGLDVEKISGYPPNYLITKVNNMTDYRGRGGFGCKPTGMICIDGVLYLAIQNILGKKPPAHGTKSQHGSDAVIVSSKDYGITWEPDRKSFNRPMFPGNYFGGPAFINFGKNNSNSRDRYVYAVSTDQWDNGSHLRLGHVDKDSILSAESWEWVSSLDEANNPTWTSDLTKSIPVLSRSREISLPDMVYLSEIDCYLLVTCIFNEDFAHSAGSRLSIYESPEPWGPFKLVHEEDWENKDVTPYNPRIPLKWLKFSKNEVRGWLQFSGSWRKNSPYYRSHVREFKMTFVTR